MEIDKYAKELLNVITDCMNEIVVNNNNNNPKKLMEFILKKLIKITNNKFGFIGEILTNRQGNSFLKYQTIIKFSLSLNQYLEIDNNLTEINEEYNFNPLYNLIYNEKKIIISNDVENDIKKLTKNSNEKNEKNNEIKNLIGIPLFNKNEIISILVVGNYDGIYDKSYLEFIKPFIPLITNIIIDYKNKISLNYQRDIFLSHMSHEIRTPLNGIIGMGQFLIDTKLNQEQTRMIHIINKCSLQLLSFVNDLLDFSHITDGKINLEMKEFDLEECLKSSIELFQLEIDEKKILIKIDYDKKLSTKIIHDRQRIQQILVNLISNSIKFSNTNLNINQNTKNKNKSFIKISLKLDKFISDNEIIFKLQIEDNGFGINQQDLEKINQKLKEDEEQQSSNNYSINYSIGLGLPITKFLINKMKGNMKIESVEKKGTIISILIPSTIISNSYSSFNSSFNSSKNIKNQLNENKQVLIISHNLEKRIALVSSVINMGLLPIPVNTIEEGNIYLTNMNTKFNLVILLINSNEDIINTLGTSDMGNQRYQIYKLIKNCQNKNNNTEILLFTENLKENITTDIFNFIEHKFNINFNLNNIELNINNILLKTFNNINSNTNNNSNTNSNSNFKEKIKNFKEKYDLSDLKILSVEDNYSNQTVLNKMLTELGVLSNNITCVFDGINFIENLENLENKNESNTYDIVFIDLKMPRLNGIEATKEILQKNLKKNMFFVAITATVTEDTIKECFKIGMDAFIPKPIDITDLLKILKVIVN